MTMGNTKRAAIVTTLVLASLVVVGTAAATPKQKGRPAAEKALRKQVQSLERQLRQVTAERNSELQQITGLQEQVRTLQTQVRTLQTHVTTLQSRLAMIPQPLTTAVQQVKEEVEWAVADTGMPASAYTRDALDGLSAMDYVAGHVSAGAYGYLETHQLPLPVATANVILGVQAGICGDAVIAYAAIMQQLGYQVRSVQFYFDDPVPDNHIGVEVFYGGGWHYFDPTFGAYWTDSSSNVLSIAQIRAGDGVEHKDSLGFTNVIEDPWFDGDDTGFITAPETVVVVGADNLTS